MSRRKEAVAGTRDCGESGVTSAGDGTVVIKVTLDNNLLS